MSISRFGIKVSGSGVALYVKESLPYPTVKMKSEKLELLLVEISPTQAKSFLVICWYRPPTSGVDEESFENLRDTLKQLDKEEKKSVLIGDANCNIASKQNNNTKRQKYQCEQLVNPI